METSKPIETLSKEPAEKIFEESLTGPLKKSLWKLQNPIETLEGALYRDLLKEILMEASKPYRNPRRSLI